MNTRRFKRIFSILMATMLLFAISTTAFAAESNTNEVVTQSAGNVIAFQSATLSSGTGSFPLTLSSGNYSADFTVAIFNKIPDLAN